MRALIASSATGGHIYPALAIADEIKRREPAADILFVGAKWEIGADIVKAAGYRQEFIEISGFDRKNPLKNFGTLRDLVRANGAINSILRGFVPDICIGTGGHVAGPVIRCAKKAGIRTVIQEQNVLPGMANRLAAKYADRIFVGFEETVSYFRKPAKVVVSGNPVRSAFAEAAERRADFREKYGVPENALCVLIFGGSQGAEAINAAALEAVAKFGTKGDIHFIIVTGRKLYTDIKGKVIEKFAVIPSRLVLMDYAEAIYELFAAADLVVARAGALTVTEIAHSRKASILVPSPNVTNNHQYFNAKALADAGAAVLMEEAEVVGGGLADGIGRFAAEPELAREMGRLAGKTAKPDAVGVIVDEIFRG